jgi:lupus La protein
MEAIRKQVEFYFSESNYRKDTFLRAAAESDPEGFVPISVLLTFNKLKLLTTDVKEVADAVTESSTVVLSSDDKKIKRTEPLPDLDTSADRTLYVKGFPLDDNDVTIEEIAEQFSTFGKVLYVRLRRDNDKKFKGSCFVEFSSESEMQAAHTAANLNETMNLKFKDTPFLCVIPFKVWHSNKQAKYSKRKDEKPTAPESGKRKISEVESAPSFESGLLVKLTHVPTDTTAISLKEFLKQHADVKFVEYTVGETEAVVRLGDAESAKKLADLKPVFKVGDSESALEGLVISGDEETAFWMKKNSENRNNNNRGNKGSHKGGKGRGNFKKQRR